MQECARSELISVVLYILLDNMIFPYKCFYSDELTDGSLHNLADLTEYFHLKKYVQDAERVQWYLSSTSEALSIITVLQVAKCISKLVCTELQLPHSRFP